MGKFWDRLGRLFKKAEKKQSLQAMHDVLQRRYDSDNWDLATRQSANSYQTRERRQSLRDLARYEVQNNPHLAGLIQKIANEIVGKGPRLSIEPTTSNQAANRAANRYEKRWQEYAEEVDFNQVLREMCLERPVGGESFTCWFPNPQLETVPIGIQVYEGDQFQTPENFDIFPRQGENDGRVDGVHFDVYGNVTAYDRLKFHPYGRNGQFGVLNITPDQFDTIDQAVCFHWFRKDRPSQHRGIPEVAPMLEIYQKLRRFIESKVGQEELRAKMLGAVYTTCSPDEVADLGDSPITMRINDGQFKTMPEGWRAEMFRFDATGAGVSEFMRSSLAWATQALLAPWNVAQGDSSDYNFASGRLDFLMFYNYIEIMRRNLETQFFKKFFSWWSVIAPPQSSLGPYRVKWNWDRREPIDQTKEAQYFKILKEAGLIDEVEYARRQGENATDFFEKQIRHEFEKRRIENDLEKEFGFELSKTKRQDPDLKRQKDALALQQLGLARERANTVGDQKLSQELGSIMEDIARELDEESTQ